MNFWLGVLGTWIFSDSIYSLMLYLSADGHSGKKQTWARDHWVRIVRALVGIVVVLIGVMS